jgi:type III secretion protein Q
MNMRVDLLHESERAAAAAPAATELSASPLLPRCEPAMARVFERLYRRHDAIGLPLDAPRNAVLHWRCDARDAAALEGCTRYRFRVGAHAGWLGLSEIAHAMLLKESQPARLPLELRCVLLADALAGAVDALEQATRQRFEWTLPEPHDPAATALRLDAFDPLQCLCFDLALADASQRAGIGFVRMDDAQALDDLSRSWQPAPRPGALPPAFALPLSFELGRTPLRLHELRTIEPGDIVAIEQWQSHGEGIVCTLVLGPGQRTSVRARADGSTLTVMDDGKEFRMTTHSTDTSNETEATADASSPAGLDRLDSMEVALRFEVGDLRVSLRELRSLQAGHVFDLGQPLNRCTVRILAHGNLLGSGHLVAVGDRLGVRVAEFAVDHVRTTGP